MLGDKLGGASEAEVISRVRRLKEQRVIRQISAIFDTKSLGYESSLVAVKCDPALVDEVAAVIGAHPGVSHNYKRDHAFNLWYTIAVAPSSKLGLERTTQILHETSGALGTLLMPTLHLFKIGVELDVEGKTIEAEAKRSRLWANWTFDSSARCRKTSPLTRSHSLQSPHDWASASTLCRSSRLR